MTRRLRIIGGEWRSRKISFAAVEGLRPTPDRVRETLFNWLQFSISDKRCLDVFAGSGILGIEAASRGASSVLLIENDSEACAAIAAAIEMLGAERLELRHADAIKLLETPANQAYDIVFVDPPFRKNLVAGTVERLETRGWVLPGSKIYIEAQAGARLVELPGAWQMLKSGTAGDVAYYLYEKN
ncbi:MAG: 16S rRNA (guanine(966)-N(2))-methyltransferase RsmD [Methylococcaceae bacterium]|nr:16S rRNA (guanine(966)-N(2))-methyltransferase RsmD [Methylococcaceae bacterium]MCI0732489.1 16S rRNA (guanine(966)-N(2))-methyltransferase RsmD [Methylococcaceae bacterium]